MQLFLIFLLTCTLIAGGIADSTTDYIRSSCRATRYPNLCLKSLAVYANAIQRDPVQLALAATNVTYARIQFVSNHVSVLYKNSPSASAAANKREVAALHDCVTTLDDAVGLTRRSADELARVYMSVGPEVTWRVSNAQTWLSAVMTDEGTCDDGFERVRRSRVKGDVCRRVGLAKKYTSNALALVNSLVANR